MLIGVSDMNWLKAELNDAIAFLQSKRTKITALFVAILVLFGPAIGVDVSEGEANETFVRLFDAAIEVVSIALVIVGWVVSDALRPVKRKDKAD